MPRYRLIRPHRVDGVDRGAGFELSVPEQHGAWLESQGFAVRVDGPPVAALLQPRAAPPSLPPLPAFVKRCCGWR